MVRERSVEEFLVDGVEDLGGRAPKWTSPSNNGVPDRMIFIPLLAPWTVETKAPGKRAEGLQIEWATWLTDNGFNYALLDTKPKVASWLAQRKMELSKLRHLL